MAPALRTKGGSEGQAHVFISCGEWEEHAMMQGDVNGARAMVAHVHAYRDRCARRRTSKMSPAADGRRQHASASAMGRLRRGGGAAEVVEGVEVVPKDDLERVPDPRSHASGITSWLTRRAGGLLAQGAPRGLLVRTTSWFERASSNCKVTFPVGGATKYAFLRWMVETKRDISI